METKKLSLFSDEHQKDFSDLPPLDSGESGRTWSFSCGGRGMKDNEWCISVFRGDVTDVYPLPDCINTIINTSAQWGKDDVRRQIKAALGL